MAINHSYVGYVQIKTAHLKNNLSKYLRQIRRTGETIIVCDRDEPVAALSPISRDDDAEWHRYRAEALARAQKIGFKLEIPLKRPISLATPPMEPRLAADGRTDISTIDLVRGGRKY